MSESVVKHDVNQKLIQKSRKRCKEIGLDPKIPPPIRAIDKNLVERIIAKNEELIEHTKSVLHIIASFIKNAEHMAFLFDHEGRMIYKTLSPNITDESSNPDMQIGANWREEYKGTNAVGIALIDKHPIIVKGNEHFFEENQGLACAAAPIFNPANEVIGVINLCSTIDKYHPLALPFAMMVARSIQARLKMAEGEAFRSATKAKPFSMYSSGNVQYTFSDIIRNCKKMNRVVDLANKASKTDFPTLITGETGTGKELIAQSIHEASERRDKPFIAVNCSSIPESLIDSELFGYEKGAFTGANSKGNKGKFEAANGGTIFLDEIGDMSLRAQNALLRVLQERKITRIGSARAIPIDVRVVAATHRNLLKEIKEGRFRSDLYYRLKVIEIKLPALRERTDIIYLAENLLSSMGYDPQQLSFAAKEKLRNYHWPGNVRELKSVLMQAVFLSDGEIIEPWHIQIATDDHGLGQPFNKTNNITNMQEIMSLKESEKRLILNVLTAKKWNISDSAKTLEIARSTLQRKIKEYNLVR